ncbi:hypothetical protein [Nocardiopsis suaedae]|uniref:Uncharacterized protein n=1 Tax=Nocardiopsis suaedae TaxID=3018444 RepID=A0ABT4TKM6_9ACTN|nr:hypothetical protein [Nocardiopsis suaedae]MDA2804935.1 hypothetical protein [Nocardiopsis suaedae]
METRVSGHASLGNALFISVFTAVAMWFITKMLVLPRFELWDDEVRIYNLLSVAHIPRGAIEAVGNLSRPTVLVVGGKEYWSAHLTPSLIGALTGYPTHKRVLDELVRYSANTRGDKAVGAEVRVRPYLGLRILIPTFAGFFLGVML